MDPSIGQRSFDLDFAPFDDLDGSEMEGAKICGWSRPVLKQKNADPKVGVDMERETGFEPATSSMAS